MPIELSSDDLDLRRFVRPGDTIVISHGSAEPLTLTEALVAQRAELGGVSVFLGVSFAGTFKSEHTDHLRFRSWGAIGHLGLARAGLVDIVPCHYSNIPGFLASKAIPCDVAFIQASVDAEGRLSMGACWDYPHAAARNARVVVAEVNDQAPWTYSPEMAAGLRVDYIVRTSRPLVHVPAAKIGEIERRISAYVGEFIGDGAVIELGIGSIPDAILASLGDRRNLGVHSGQLGDSIVDLVATGAVTNATKSIDPGVITAGILFGTPKLFNFAHRNETLQMRPTSYTHDARVLSRLDRFVAINSAIEVDLTGQVNAEMAGAHYMGAIGGQLDFVRAGMASPGGRSIIALPSTAKDGALSRIVSSLSAGITTTPRSDADLVITEWGIADLRGQPLAERRRRMIAIADPAFRESLEREAGT